MSRTGSSRLTRADLRGVARASELLLRPLDHPDVDSWRVAVSQSLKSLIGADTSTWYLPLERVRSFFTRDMPLKVPDSYLANLRPLERRWSIWDRQAALGVFDRDVFWKPHRDAFLRSPYYNEWVVPNRLFTALGISARFGDQPFGSQRVPTLWFHHDRRRAPGAGGRGRAILKRLLPAFTAGVEILRVTGVHRGALTTILDRLGCAILIVDDTGRQIHRTPALQQLLDDDAEAPKLTAAMMAAAGSASRQALAESARRGAPSAQPGDVADDVRTASATYRVRASLAPASLVGSRPCALVSCERADSPPLDAVSLSDRFGLTPAQARIARLIAEGHSTDAIASALQISTHTVRRHAEQVRARLGVHRAVEIAAVIGRTHRDPS